MSSSDEDIQRVAGRYNEQSPSQILPRPLWQLLFFLLMWQSLYRVSNAAVNVLLKFITLFVRLFGQVFAPTANADAIHKFSAVIPNSTIAAHKLLWNTNQDEFTSYVVCPKCDSVYEYDDCIVSSGGMKESRLCRHIAYPQHPHASRRRECGAPLLKKQ